MQAYLASPAGQVEIQQLLGALLAVPAIQKAVTDQVPDYVWENYSLQISAGAAALVGLGYLLNE